MSTNSTNSSSATATNYGYASVGSGGVLANILILTVSLSDRKFLRQSSTMVGIAISHFLCALTVAATGIYRLVNSAVLNQMAPAWSCILRIYPILFPFAFQSMGLMLIMVGLERFSVFMFPHWYRAKWTHTKCWKMVGVVYILTTVSCSGGLYKAWYQPDTTLNCYASANFGVEYIAYSCCVSAVGGTVAVILTVMGLIRGTTTAKSLPLLSGEAGRYRRQLKLTRSMLSVAVCDVCLVVIPSILYMISMINHGLFPTTVVSDLAYATNITYCINSMTSLGPYLAFNRQFRTRAFQLLRCQKPNGVVGPEEKQGVRALDSRTAASRHI